MLFTQRDYRLRTDEVEWPLVRCRRCGLGYLNPRPTPSEVARYYPQRYYAHRPGQHARYERELAFVGPGPGRLLDIGAAGGEFLLVARDRGWDVAGIEPFASPTDAAKDLDISHEAFPGRTTLASESFDRITAWAVFEHLHDPAAGFAEAARLLRPGGRLVVQVPNQRSIATLWGRQEDVPRHLYFFTPRTLSAYGSRFGLELRRVVHTTDLHGGSGRGVLRLALVRGTGRSVSEFFDIWHTPLRERARRWPWLMPAWIAASLVERVVLADAVVRGLRMSGQIVVEFAKPASRTAEAA